MSEYHAVHPPPKASKVALTRSKQYWGGLISRVLLRPANLLQSDGGERGEGGGEGGDGCAGGSEH